MAHDVEPSPASCTTMTAAADRRSFDPRPLPFGALETWEGQVPEFARTHRVIAPEICSGSDRAFPKAADDVEKQGARLSAGCLTAWALGRSGDRWRVVWRLCCWKAGQAPAHLGKLVLIDGWACSDSRGVEHGDRELRRQAAHRRPAHSAERGGARMLKTLFYKPHHHSHLYPAADPARGVGRTAMPSARSATTWKRRAALPSELHELGAKTLLIWGRHDPLILPSIGAQARGGDSRPQILYFESSAHSPMIEERPSFQRGRSCDFR